MTRTHIVHDNDDDVVVDQTYSRQVPRDRGTNWLPLLVIPLFLLLGLWALNPRPATEINNTQTAPTTVPGASEQFGVGGGPAETETPTTSPTRTPTPEERTDTVTPSMEVSPSVSPTPDSGL